MFSKISRYRELTDVVTMDAAGRRQTSRELRLPAATPGRYRHTLVDSDRLDRLAGYYYGQSRTWWRICDGNPDILSPQELVGAEPVLETRLTVRPAAGGTADWAALLRALRVLVGVERAVLDGIADSGAGHILVRFNRLNLGVPELAEAITAQGLTPTGAQRLGRTGHQLVVPPDPGR